MSKQVIWTVQAVLDEPDGDVKPGQARAVVAITPTLRVAFTEAALEIDMGEGRVAYVPWTLIGRCVVPEPKPLCNCERCGRLLMTNSTGNFRSSLDADGNVLWTGVCYGCLRDDED